MKQVFMVEFVLPEEFTNDFVELIPKQRYIINQMLVEGHIQNYSLAEDRSKLWAIMLAESEFEVMELITQMPLVDFMMPSITPLMFHNTAMDVMQFSLN